MESKIAKLSPFLKEFAKKKKVQRRILNDELSKMELQQLIKKEKNSLLKLLVDKTEDFETLEILSAYKGSKKVRSVALQKMKKAGNK